MRVRSLEVHDVELHVGQSYRQEIGGLGSAGYAWDHVIIGAAGVVSVELVPGSAPPRPPPGGLPPDNFSTNYVAVIEALKPGAVTVRFSQRQPWQKEGAALRQVDIRAHILAH